MFRRKKTKAPLVVQTAQPSPELDALLTKTKEIVRKVHAAMDSIIEQTPAGQQ